MLLPVIPYTYVCIRLPHIQLSVIILFAGVNRHWEDSEVLTGVTMRISGFWHVICSGLHGVTYQRELS